MESRRKEELDACTLELIRQVEAEGLIKAPKHMKQEILERSRRMDYQISVKTKEISKKLQFFFYSLKVGTAVVTALFLLFLVPKELPKAEPELKHAPRQEEPLGVRFNQGLENLGEIFNQIQLSNYFIQMED